MSEFRRILLDGYPTAVERHGDELVAGDGRITAVAGAIHLPPTEPSKIIAVHLNYASRTDEFLTKLPPAPTYFHKPITALNSHDAGVVRPRGCKWLNYEGEIVIVIGRTCRNVSPGEARDYIAGYTIGNDYGLHDFRDTDAGSMLRVKGRDTLAPVGPGVVTDWDFHGKEIQTRVNGQVKQSSTTDEMEWDMHYLVADIARTITLVPGDLLFSVNDQYRIVRSKMKVWPDPNPLAKRRSSAATACSVWCGTLLRPGTGTVVLVPGLASGKNTLRSKRRRPQHSG